MQSPEFFEQLAAALRENGVTGRAEKQLAAEFRDHFECGLQERLEQGMAPREAELQAVAALGDPDYLAETAANKWRARLWSNRHPWIFGLVSGLGTYLLAVLLVAITACVAFYLKGEGWLSPESPLVGLLVFLGLLINWLPALAGGLWMGWRYRAKRFQARTFWIGCAGVALGTSLLWVDLIVPTAEHHGSLSLIPGPLAAVFLWPVAILMHKEKELGYGHWGPFLGSITMWLQVALTFVYAWAVYATRLTGFRQREHNTW